MKERRKTERSKKLVLAAAVAAPEAPVEMDSMIKEVRRSSRSSALPSRVAHPAICARWQVEKDFYRLIDTNASAALSAEKEAMEKKSKETAESKSS